jgi:putative YphP/YqiW family bacilliredoxin
MSTYPAEAVMPMKLELLANGFTELTAETVAPSLEGQGTSLVVINSICGCAARTARPGVLLALEDAAKKPANLYTVFAGFDTDAVAEVRNHTKPYPASSPSIGLFKDGELVHFVERHMIEGRPAEMIAQHLEAVFEEYC